MTSEELNTSLNDLLHRMIETRLEGKPFTVEGRELSTLAAVVIFALEQLGDDPIEGVNAIFARPAPK